MVRAPITAHGRVACASRVCREAGSIARRFADDRVERRRALARRILLVRSHGERGQGKEEGDNTDKPSGTGSGVRPGALNRDSGRRTRQSASQRLGRPGEDKGDNGAGEVGKDGTSDGFSFESRPSDDDGWGKEPFGFGVGMDPWVPEEGGDFSFPGGKDPRRRYSGTKVPRDQWLKPIVDRNSVLDQLDPDADRAEQRLLVETEANAWETREGIKFAVLYLILLPLASSFLVSRVFAQSVLEFCRQRNDSAFELTTKQRVEGGREMRAEELRMRMEAAIGMAPPLTDSELVSELHEEAARYEEEKKLENEQALVNLMSDIVAGTVLFSSLALNSFGRRLLFNTISRFAGGLSDTSKAFLIILVADTLLGYHSEEGWTAALTLLAGRYGSEPGEEPIALFVAVLPVTLDTLFKYWIFRGLNRQSPSAAVTLKEMDRH